MNSSDAITMLDLEGNITAWNGAAERMYGYSEAEALRLSLSQIVPESLRDGELAVLERLRAGQLLESHETKRVCKDGSVRDIWLTATTLRDELGKPIAIATTERDMTEGKVAAHIEHLATHDSLTGLSNRALMNDLASHAIVQAHRRGGRMALLFVDLDRFKGVNDSLGHRAGDRLLQAVAKRLTQCVRAEDTIVRQGGDEFVVILSEITQTRDAANVAEKIRQAILEPFRLDEVEITCSASIGISLYPDDAGDLDTLLKNADAAMYRAKSQGRNACCFFTPDMYVGRRERLSLEQRLRGAVQRGELYLHYQPQVDLVSGRINGVEALLRWRHPELGDLSADHFIPVAEESGLIVQLGQWMLLDACRQARAWQAAGLRPILLAANLSALEFRQPHLVESVIDILQTSGLDPQYLELELTESMLMHEAEAMSSMQRLKAMGVRFAIDDFGTGYSNLSYLRRFPIHRLKIDLSFLRDITTDQGTAAVTRAIIAMAKTLQLRVLAEGVETRDQLGIISDQGCDELQGFYFSRPVPADEVAKVLQQDRRLSH
jgi:diguanylate cyclase (GGDEF)-like protein/PAS domain S-box-containing protein